MFSCRSSESVGGGEFRIFLHCHLEPVIHVYNPEKAFVCQHSFYTILILMVSFRRKIHW